VSKEEAIANRARNSRLYPGDSLHPHCLSNLELRLMLMEWILLQTTFFF